MAFSYLLPDRVQRVRRHNPEQVHLDSHQTNPVTLEWLQRVHSEIDQQDDRIRESATTEELRARRGKREGLVLALEILQTIAEEVRHGELRAIEEDADGDRQVDVEKVQ